MKKHVVVIGAGLAGLSSAYELSKQDDIRVTVLEREGSVGGRVQSLPVNNKPVDFGGFIIYPWYEQYHRLIDELDVRDRLLPIPLHDILYEVYNNGEYIPGSQIPFSTTEKVKIWTKSFLRLLRAGDVDMPDLHRFDDKTVAEYLRDALDKPQHAGLFETFFDIVNQGYCYGPVSETKAAFMAPIVRQTHLHGDIEKAFYFPDGNAAFTEALADAIKQNGGEIRLNEAVEAIDGKTVISKQGVYEADVIVVAARVSPALHASVLPGVDMACRYTEFVTATLRFSDVPRVNGQTDWGAVFYHPRVDMPMQILSSINLPTLYDGQLEGCVNVNIIVREGGGNISASSLQAAMADDIASRFPDVKFEAITQMHHWKQTMPISQEVFVEQVRARQGVNDCYFAGDFLGAPSMETAIVTGVKAAKRIKDALGL